MLRAARGQWADQLPWVPRIDLWYNSNSMRGTLPPPFKKEATLDEIADAIGGGYHKIVPEFLNVRSPDDNIDRGLGIYRLWGMAFRSELVGVEREVRKEGDFTRVTYHTPGGSIYPWGKRHHAARCPIRQASADYRNGPEAGKTADEGLARMKLRSSGTF
jgi:hypothetical protein